jgi:hypothetical protein
MINYVCIDKETKKIVYFTAAYDKLKEKYRLINLTTGEIEKSLFDSISHLLAVLEILYDIKMKSEI